MDPNPKSTSLCSAQPSGYGSNKNKNKSRGPQVLVHVSFYQDSILGNYIISPTAK